MAAEVNTKRRVAPPAEPGGDSKSARTRVRILDAAAHVLSVKGYAGMRLSDVAEVAKVQAPAIYYYFPSRDDLIEEVMWAGIADMREYLIGVLAAAPKDLGPMERIMLAVDAQLRHQLELSDYATASVRNSGQVPESIRKRQIAEMARYAEVWQKLFTAAIAAGEIDPSIDRYIAQRLVMGALTWTTEWWNPRRGSLDLVVATAQRLIRNGLAPA